MVTYVDDYSASNAFEGYSVAEAASQTVLDVNDIVNEMVSGLKEAEHVYFVENGVEVVYEENVVTKAASWVWEHIKSAISKVKELFEKLIAKVQDAMRNAKAAFIRAGVKKDKVNEAFALISRGNQPGVDLNKVAEKIVKMAGSTVRIIDKDENFVTQHEVMDAAAAEFDSDYKAVGGLEGVSGKLPGARDARLLLLHRMNASEGSNIDLKDIKLNDTVRDVIVNYIFGNTAEDIRSITKGKNKAIEALKKKQPSKEDIKKNENSAKKMEQISNGIKYVTTVSSAAVTLYWDFFKAYAGMAKGLVLFAKSYDKVTGKAMKEDEKNKKAGDATVADKLPGQGKDERGKRPTKRQRQKVKDRINSTIAPVVKAHYQTTPDEVEDWKNAMEDMQHGSSLRF